MDKNVLGTAFIEKASTSLNNSARSDIKIFVSHRIDMDTSVFDNHLLVPVRCGSILDEHLNADIIGDDTGENISEKRMTFCELTVQYWAWKNVQADYYGLFHYRRFLNFSKFHYMEDGYGNILSEFIDEDSKWQYGLEEDQMRALIERYDLIIPTKNYVDNFPEHYRSLYDHWDKAEHLHSKDLRIMLDVIAHVQPDYYETAKEYLEGTGAYFANIFIMKRKLFYEYCQWLFPILFELEREIDISHYTQEGQRTVAHLAERLLGIYISRLRKKDLSVKIKELQRVFFTKPEKKILFLNSAFQSEIDQTIPIVVTSRSVFAPVSAVSLQSIIENASDNYNYDIVIIETDITSKDKRVIKKMAEGKSNFSIRFFNATPIVENYRLRADGTQHVPVETFYRFLIPDIFPDYDKVLYLDGDLVCETDVANLYRLDIDGYMIAAARDPDVSGQMNMPGSDVLTYAIRTLKMRNPYDYFQAGVLLLNTKKFRERYSTEQWLTFAQHGYRYQDQDILNRYCHGHVKFLDMAWNVLIDCNNYRVPVVIQHAVADVRQEYQKARAKPYIVHFAGFEKPWERRNVDFEEEFWKYARHTPYYERLLFNMTAPQPVKNDGLPPIGVKGAVKIYIKKKVNIWFPTGTKRRMIIKQLFGRFAKWL